MKKRRTLVISLLLIAALALGIGYAGVSTTLKITGTASSAQQAIDVVFTEGIKKETSSVNDDVKANILATSDAAFTSETIEVKPVVKGLTYKDDSITFTYTITNKNDYDVTLAKPTITYAANTVLNVTTNFAGDTMTLAAGAKYKLDVTVSLATVSADPVTNETFTVSIDAYAGTQSN
jgi:hypothetical protein